MQKARNYGSVVKKEKAPTLGPGDYIAVLVGISSVSPKHEGANFEVAENEWNQEAMLFESVGKDGVTGRISVYNSFMGYPRHEEVSKSETLCKEWVSKAMEREGFDLKAYKVTAAEFKKLSPKAQFSRLFEPGTDGSCVDRVTRFRLTDAVLVEDDDFVSLAPIEEQGPRTRAALEITGRNLNSIGCDDMNQAQELDPNTDKRYVVLKVKPVEYGEGERSKAQIKGATTKEKYAEHIEAYVGA